jgi:hypothetical protein
MNKFVLLGLGAPPPPPPPPPPSPLSPPPPRHQLPRLGLLADYGSLGSAASLLCAQVQRLKQSGQLNYIFGTTYIENG